MIGIVVGGVGALFAMAVWTVIASFIYCRLSGHMSLFMFPWDQWLDIAPYWTVTGWTEIYVAVSAIVASLPFVALVSLYRRRSNRPALYGKTRFADRREMNDNGIKTSRRLP